MSIRKGNLILASQGVIAGDLDNYVKKSGSTMTGMLHFEKGDGIRLNTNAGSKYLIYGNATTTDAVYTQIIDSSNNIDYYKFIDSDGKLYSGNNEVATTNQLPTITTTSGSESISDGVNTLNFGSNAFNSTAYLPLSGGSLTNDLIVTPGHGLLLKAQDDQGDLGAQFNIIGSLHNDPKSLYINVLNENGVAHKYNKFMDYDGHLYCNGNQVATSNPNLLINGDFRINQRGQTTYSTGGQYSVDRWILRNSCVVTKQTNGITLTSAGLPDEPSGIFQPIENFENLLGKTVTVSLKLSNVNVASSSYMQFGICNGTSANSIGTHVGARFKYYPSTDIVSLTTQIPSTLANNYLNVYLIYVGGHSVSTDSVTIEYIKLEIGSNATQLSPKPYAQELADCQRYYQIIKSSNQYAIYAETWFNGGTTNCDGFIHIPVTMRTTPTMTINGSLKIISKTGGSYTYTSAAVHTLYDNQILVRFVTSGGTQGQGCMIQANNDTTTSIEFDSEIT